MCRLSNFVKNNSTKNPLSMKKLNEKRKQCMRKKAQKNGSGWIRSPSQPFPRNVKCLQARRATDCASAL